MIRSFSKAPDTSGKVGALIMFFFALIAASKWLAAFNLFFLLLVLRDMLAVWLLLTRKNSVSDSQNSLMYLSYFSSAMPFIYLNESVSSNNVSTTINILTTLGFCLSTLALIDLGKSFGVSPAKRHVVNTGVYKFFNHPMYLGYAIAEAGFIFVNRSNFFIYLISLGLYIVRARAENKVLSSTN